MTVAVAARRRTPSGTRDRVKVNLRLVLGCQIAPGGRRNVHLVAPSLVAAFDGRRVKNDQRDCKLLGDLLRANMLPEAWIAPPEVREQRELVRYRAKLVGLRSGLRAQAHAVLAKLGVAVPMTDLFGVSGRQLLHHLCDDDPRFRSAYGQRIESIIVLVDALTHEIDEFNASIAHVFRDHAGYHAIQQIPGIGPILAAVFVAEIGDVTGFPSPTEMCSWVGVTPRHRESDRTVKRGAITNQGSKLVRWAAIEAAKKLRRDSWLYDLRVALAERRNNRKIAKTAEPASTTTTSTLPTSRAPTTDSPTARRT
jgi:transposase